MKVLLTDQLTMGFQVVKKRNEILQLLMMEPNVAILDETDSVDIDAQTVAQGINFYRNQRSIILITHYHNSDYLDPTKYIFYR